MKNETIGRQQLAFGIYRISLCYLSALRAATRMLMMHNDGRWQQVSDKSLG
jgi:hypothetical protein